MNAILDNEKKYSEFLVEYDPENLVVYLSGLDADGFWIELNVQEDINDPEEFARGFEHAMTQQGVKVSIEAVVYE